MRSGTKYLWLCKRDIEANGVFFRANDIYYEKDGIVMDDNNKDVEVGGIYNGKVSLRFGLALELSRNGLKIRTRLLWVVTIMVL